MTAAGPSRRSAAPRILAAARELFHERGIRAVGVDEIVRHADVSKPTLYRIFSSKDELVAACLEQIAGELRTELEARMAKAGADPLARLRALIRFCAEIIERPGFRGSPLSITAVEFPEPDHPGREVAEAGKAELRKRLLGLTQQLPVENPARLADSLILVIEGAFATRDILGKDGPAKILTEAADRLIDSYLLGATQKPPVKRHSG